MVVVVVMVGFLVVLVCFFFGVRFLPGVHAVVVSIMIRSREHKLLCFAKGGTLSLGRDKLSSAEESVDREFGLLQGQH